MKCIRTPNCVISDDDEDDDDNSSNDLASATVKNTFSDAAKSAKRTKARETLFQRIEESRKSLEDELGTDKFLKVYRYIQVGFFAIFPENLGNETSTVRGLMLLSETL